MTEALSFGIVAVLWFSSAAPPSPSDSCAA